MFLFLILISCGRGTRDEAIEALPPAEFRQRLSTGVVLVDVRRPEEYASGFIAGAVNLDFYSSGFADGLDSLETSKTYLLYCASGARSDRAAIVMKAKGFESVSTLKGGLDAWTAEGLSLEP